MPLKAPAFAEKDLKQWRLVDKRLREAFATEVAARGGLAGTWDDPKRKLHLDEYLSPFLFGIVNPVVETMRGLCAATVGVGAAGGVECLQPDFRS